MRLKLSSFHLCVALFSVCFAALSQDTGATGKSAFTAADIHPSPAGLRTSAHMARKIGPVMAGGLLQMRNATILDMISAAYGLDRHKVTGGPRWLDWDRFDINAVAPADTSPENQMAMLRTLLIDRFKLVSHAGTQPVDAWALSATQKPKITQANADDGACQVDPKASVAAARTGDPDNPVSAPLRTFNCVNVSMSAFATQLATLTPSYFKSVPAVDQTGLTGGWTFRLTVTPNAALATATGGISLEAALKHLGLGLTLKPVTANVLVVDAASEAPMPNDPAIAKAIASKLPDGFEVASVKPDAPAATNLAELMRMSMKVKPGGGIVYRSVPFSTLVENAFVNEIGGPIMTGDRIVGYPASLVVKKFDIEANPPLQTGATPTANGAAGPLDNEAALRMLKKLLIERFAIQYHTEIRQLDGFNLIVTRPDKIRAADPNERTGMTTDRGQGVLSFRTTFQNVSMPEIAGQLTYAGSSETQGMPIVDATGLNGRYDLAIEFNMGVGAIVANPQMAQELTKGIGLTDALRSAGLGLRKAKVPVKVLVIDHVNSAPTEN